DAAAISFGALTLLACGHVLASPVSARPRDYAVMSAGLAGALLSKLDTFFLMPLVLAAAIVGGGPVARVSSGLSRRVVRVILVSTVPAALLAAWWVVYGHRFGAGLGRQAGFSAILPWTLFASVEWARMISAFATLNAAWWGAVGFDSSIAWPRSVNLAFALPFVILVAAGIALVVDGRRWHGDRRSIRVAIGWLYLAAAILIYATIARQVVPSIDYAANARFVLPASPAIALAVALGGSYLPLGRGRVPLAIGYLAAILGLAVATPLFLVPQLHVPTIPARLVRDERELTAPGVAHFSDDIDLLSIGGIPDSLLPGRPMPLHLLWRDDHPPAQNFVAS
ncbi:MAG TPA: hypothetical protein VFZ25_11390, partial [Chloroflexota bacterium]|nr:hypothetical protein [Chloroflexota bacterium]